MENKMTMLIMSCDKFYDLWQGHVKLLEENWPDRDMDTYIVTDAETSSNFENVRIIAAGDKVEWSERLAYALSFVDTEYVFITLDDYFLIKTVDNARMKSLAEMMTRESADYVRIFHRPHRATGKKLGNYIGLYEINTTYTYSVNLYPGIWRKSFLEKALEKPRNPWQFEVSLAKTARDNNAYCVADLRKDFRILDVVRKGKLLHKAAAYFKKHPDLYCGSREVNFRSYEIKLGIRSFGAEYAPLPVVNWARNFMIKRGHHYFSQEAEK